MEEEEMGGTCGTCGERRKVGGNFKKRGHLENPDVDGRIILKCMLNRLRWWIGLMWLRIDSARLLCTR
jgi:hypothetical protein